MGKRAPILGIAGLIFILFGLLEHWMTLLPQQSFFEFGWFSLLHIGAGIVCILWWLSSGSGSLFEFVQRRSTRYGTNAIVYSLVFVAVIGMLNFLAVRYNKRWDLSSAAVNSLTDASRQVLDKIEGEVEVLAFVGPQDKDFVREVSETYGYYTDRVKWQIIDPQVSPEIAQRELISTIPTIKIKHGERNTTVSKIDEESITNGIHKVITSEQKKIYFLEGHGEPAFEDKTGPGGMGLFADTLRNQNYEVASLFAAEKPIPDDAAAIVVSTGNRDHFPAETAQIKDYLKKGGNMLLLLEPQKDAELVSLARSLGVLVGDDLVLDQQMRLFQGITIGVDVVVTEYGKHPSVSAMTDRSIFPIVRSTAPAPTPVAGITLEPLAFSSAASWAETDVAGVFDRGEAELQEGTDTPGPIPLAVAGGGAASAIGGAPDKQFKVAVFGDTSFLTNQYLRQLYNDALGQSVVGWLAGEEELIAIAPRVVRASRAYLDEDSARSVFYLSVLVLPELILLLGIAVWWRRSSL